MSVFQLQEWWNVQISQSEEFDLGCLAIGNIDNSHPSVDKIVIGSQQGMLRIYSPQRPQYRMEDLFLEESLGVPILQLLIGQFIPSVENLLGLAVLHPKKLVVYEVNAQGSKDGKGANYYSLRKCYEHNLGLDGKHFTAYNMISGPFGGVRGRDMLLVQSLDGKLQIFEQSANAFTRQLVDCLVPHPVAYLPRLDAFVATNYACRAECYRYQVLASTQTDVGGGSKAGATTGAFGLTALRSALVEWDVNMGEPCIQMTEGYFSGSETTKSCGELLILCEQSLFLVKGSGGIIQQRKLDRSPACMCTYNSATRGKQNFLVADRGGTIQVFTDFNLAWAAKVPSVPVQIAVGNFGGQSGLVVTIDDSGRLVCGYLGTKPPLTSVVSQARELDYDKVDEEHRSLLKIIRESQSENKAEPKEKLFMRTQVTRSFDNDSVSTYELPSGLAQMNLSGLGAGGDSRLVKICVRLYVSLTGSASTTDVTIVVSTADFVYAAPKNIVLKTVSGAQSTPIMTKIYFYARQDALPAGLEAQVVASYVSSNGEPRVNTIQIALPLHLACRPRPAQKTALHKITLDTDADVQPLTDLFDDYLFAYQDAGLDVKETLGNSAAQAIGFQFWSGAYVEPVSVLGTDSNNSTAISSQPAIVSILASKQAGRYRVQSDCLPALLLVVQELDRRLTQRITDLRRLKDEVADKKTLVSSAPVVSCADAVPLDEYFHCIGIHFGLRRKINDSLSQLNDAAHQFRMIEKRLLVRFKDRNPTPLGGLDTLMKETYKKILILGDSVQDNQYRLLAVSNDLHCLSKLIVQIVGLKFGMSFADRKILENCFCIGFIDSLDQGWEETVDLSLTFLLKTSLAKTAKESTTLTTSAIEMPSDIEALKKHISMVLDRISKGGKVNPSIAAAI